MTTLSTEQLDRLEATQGEERLAYVLELLYEQLEAHGGWAPRMWWKSIQFAWVESFEQWAAVVRAAREYCGAHGFDPAGIFGP